MTEYGKSAGLTSAEAKRLQARYGKNELTPRKRKSFFGKAFDIVCEPMFLLLIVSAVVYFILGEPRDGAVMLVFVAFVIGIEVVQEWKTDKTLNALKELSAPRVKVVRDGFETVIASEDLVPGDLMLLYEGVKIPADGVILRCSDFCVDESSLTGEAEGVWKTASGGAGPDGDSWRRDSCYAGTLALCGSAEVLVNRIGAATEFGRIGKNVAEAVPEKAPLQEQTEKLVKTCAAIAGILCILVGAVTWFNTGGHPFRERLTESVLSGITLAMAMIPEEFPVILTVFLSMGAWRLAKKNSLVRQLPSVETLGAVSVLCVDKTGTITENRMTVQKVWPMCASEAELMETMGLGCEPETYDPMEKAMLGHCAGHGLSEEELFSGELIKEYPFTSELMMMGHVWAKDGETVLAAKGSPEGILPICALSEKERRAARGEALAMSEGGLRVIAVARMRYPSGAEIPERLTDCRLAFCGLIGLVDPPREGVRDDIAACGRAGIRVVMLTGDNGVTASSVARAVGIRNHDSVVTGDMLGKMGETELREAVKTAGVFSRVMPEHKMRIVRALRESGETVAMTGDGVNDAPALKYADIGIAMGKRGSEVSREAADLILMDDNFTTIVETIRDGRRIYDNIRKAVSYVFTIHIPVALASLLAPTLGIPAGALMLLPLHVVLLELLIDPTCSVVLERQPAEGDIMERPPRSPKEKMLTANALAKAVLQGLAIFTAAFGAYYLKLGGSVENAPAARSMGLSIMMLANLFLVQVGSSDRDSVVHTFQKLMGDKVMWAVNIGTVALLFLTLYTPLAPLFKLAPLSAGELFTALGAAAVSVLWFEAVKAFKRARGESGDVTGVCLPRRRKGPLGARRHT